MTKSRILIADDQADIRAALAMVLGAEGYDTAGAASPAETTLLLARGGWDALLLDLNFHADTTSGAEGLALLAAIRGAQPDLPVIVLTGWGTVDLAVQALRAGAADFIEKPWENIRLLGVLRAQIALSNARQTAATLTSPPPQGAILYASPAMRAVMALVDKVAGADVPVLLTGESGTGKGVLAHYIAQASTRSKNPFVTLDLGAVPEMLIESELFGHARGAFTDAKTERVGRFEVAEGGTIFLDEIGNASGAVQTRLLAVLESGAITRVGESRPRTVDVRMIAATNAELPARMAAGSFRRDLYFRLNTVEIAVPPLRDRVEDIPMLALMFLEQSATKHGRPAREFADDAALALLAYPWPGNVRELAHVVERAALLADGPAVRAADLRLAEPGPALIERMTLDQAERYLIHRAMESAGGEAEAAAKRLGLSRSAFYRRLSALRQ